MTPEELRLHTGRRERHEATRIPDSSAWPELAALPSRSSRRLLDELRVLAASPMPITVVGASGTGKSGIARGIHEMSARRKGALVMLNVSVLSDGLASSELYGHERGAFTGASHSRWAASAALMVAPW